MQSFKVVYILCRALVSMFLNCYNPNVNWKPKWKTTVSNACLDNYFNVLTEPVVLERIIGVAKKKQRIKRRDVQPVRGVKFRSEMCVIIALDFSKRTASKSKIWTVLFYQLILEFFVKSKCWEGELINDRRIILQINFLSDNWKIKLLSFFLEFMTAPSFIWKLLVHIFCEGSFTLICPPACHGRSKLGSQNDMHTE